MLRIPSPRYSFHCCLLNVHTHSKCKCARYSYQIWHSSSQSKVGWLLQFKKKDWSLNKSLLGMVSSQSVVQIYGWEFQLPNWASWADESDINRYNISFLFKLQHQLLPTFKKLSSVVVYWKMQLKIPKYKKI